LEESGSRDSAPTSFCFRWWDFRFPSSFRGALWWDVPSWWYGNEKNYHPVGRQPILKDKTSEKNRIKIQKRGKPAKKVFSFFDTKLV